MKESKNTTPLTAVEKITNGQFELAYEINDEWFGERDNSANLIATAQLLATNAQTEAIKAQTEAIEEAQDNIAFQMGHLS